jgi:hypothetical protein
LLHRHYPASSLLRASPSPRRPDLALAGFPLCLAGTVVVGFPWFTRVPSIHAVVSTPAELPGASVAASPESTGLPRATVGSASASNFSRPHRTFTCVTAWNLRRATRWPAFLEGSDKFVSSFAAPIATGQATTPRRDFHPLKLSYFHGARRVEKWRGGLGWAYRLPTLSSVGASLAQPCSVSTSRSSNRTGGFPASGSRTRVMRSSTRSGGEV